MRSSASAGDDAAYRREAHAIKGGCGLVGALELQSIAASEENAGITANHVATLDEILAAAERLKRMLVAQRNHSQEDTVVEPVRSTA
jgi:HPt (histidine-containing phosphotransfer) domain-containing protein